MDHYIQYLYIEILFSFCPNLIGTCRKISDILKFSDFSRLSFTYQISKIPVTIMINDDKQRSLGS